MANKTGALSRKDDKMYLQMYRVFSLNYVTEAGERTEISFFFFYKKNTVIHFYFGADLISVISVQAFFT